MEKTTSKFPKTMIGDRIITETATIIGSLWIPGTQPNLLQNWIARPIPEI